MSEKELIDYLRMIVCVSDTTGVTEEVVNKLKLSDDQLRLILNMTITRESLVATISNLPNEYVYPVCLLAKKELYYTLASMCAEKYNMVADNNNQLSRGQIFDHYMKLIGQVDAEYNKFVEDGGAGTRNTLNTYDAVLPRHWWTKHNYEKGFVPALSIIVDTVTDTTVEISWLAHSRQFDRYEIYLSLTPNLDIYNPNKLKKVKPIKVLTDLKRTSLRFSNLEPKTTYYIAMQIIEKSGNKTQKEVEVTTLPVEEITPPETEV